MAQAINYEADKMLDVYIHDYLLKRNLQASAKAFRDEALLSSTHPVAIDAPGGFLLEWWSVFWDISIARTKHSEAAASYLEVQMVKARDLQRRQQQQQHPHQKPQAQQQAHQLLLQRHAQQQQRDWSPNTGLNPVGLLDTIRRQQPSGAAGVFTSKVNENTLRDPLLRDSMDIRSRLDENQGQSLDPKQISSLKLEATGIQAQRQTLDRTTGGCLQHVHNQNPPNSLNGLNKVSPVMDASSAVDSQEGSLLGTHGSNRGRRNLTLDGWPLTGLDQLRAGFQHQQNSVPPYQLYLQQQLLQAQQHLTVPPANLDHMKMRMLLNCKNAQICRDDKLRNVGDVMTNVSSQMQASGADLLNKIIQSNPLQQLYRQNQLSVQQPHNLGQNSHPLDKMIGSGTTDACLSNNGQRIDQASKMQQGRKRKLSNGPANSSGTLNTNGPSVSSVPSTPSTHTVAEAITMPSLSKNAGGSTASVMAVSEGTEMLPSVAHQFVDTDHSLVDGPLEDNVESFLSPDVGDSAGTRAAASEGFTFTEHQAIPISIKLECCVFSSNGKLLATGGHDTKVVLWCTESFTMKSVLDEHTLTITDVRFSPIKPQIATSSADQTIKIWDADNPTYSLCTFTGHSTCVTSLDFHPCKDDLVYSADANGEVRCWGVTNGCCKKVFQCDVTYIRFQPFRGRFFAGASEDAISIIDVETLATRLKLEGHRKQVTRLCWDYSGEYLASVSEDLARVWSFAPAGNGECIHEFSSSRTDFRSCCFHPAYSFLLVIRCDQLLELWNMKENKMMTIPAHEDVISALATSNVASLVASSSFDGFIKLWK